MDGVPLSAANVAIWGGSSGFHSAQSRYDGRFEIHDLKPGSHHLSVVASLGAIHQEHTLEIAGDREITIDIATEALLGQVVSGTGEPVADATVSVDGKANDPRDSFSTPTIRSGEDGVFETRLAAGTYRITVQKEGYAPAKATAEVRPGAAGAWRFG
ncbi:MAG: carboxypeptidase regulatory-like domain-containing protein [Acidobacteria bacterium]|nr:carboxypeptidase regulatory-like domain-containing protein [Acidobacteriota bacterium]